MTPPDIILALVERFERNRAAYRSGHYNETQVRREFIDPFFEALGWDVANRQGYAEAYKDVVHEETLKVGGGTKAPDYGFRIGGARKFFVEAKKPSVDIKVDVHPAYQLRRYAWSAKLSLSVLTDFEEFAAYDCRVRPDKDDKASTARVLYVPFDQYAQRWDEIAGVFSRDAILRGSFDKYAEGTASKRGTAEVDRAFLAEIERWRDLLARSIALRNAGLTQRQLNFAVQQTIDFTDPADAARHDRMVSLVERMLDLHKRAAAEAAPHLKTLLQRQIEATDRQIDALVYELYGLTDEEIRIVEEGGRTS